MFRSKKEPYLGTCFRRFFLLRRSKFKKYLGMPNYLPCFQAIFCSLIFCSSTVLLNVSLFIIAQGRFNYSTHCLLALLTSLLHHLHGYSWILTISWNSWRNQSFGFDKEKILLMGIAWVMPTTVSAQFLKKNWIKCANYVKHITPVSFCTWKSMEASVNDDRCLLITFWERWLDIHIIYITSVIYT